MRAVCARVLGRTEWGPLRAEGIDCHLGHLVVDDESLGDGNSLLDRPRLDGW